MVRGTRRWRYPPSPQNMKPNHRAPLVNLGDELEPLEPTPAESIDDAARLLEMGISKHEQDDLATALALSLSTAAGNTTTLTDEELLDLAIAESQRETTKVGASRNVLCLVGEDGEKNDNNKDDDSSQETGASWCSIADNSERISDEDVWDVLSLPDSVMSFESGATTPSTAKSGTQPFSYRDALLAVTTKNTDVQESTAQEDVGLPGPVKPPPLPLMPTIPESSHDSDPPSQTEQDTTFDAIFVRDGAKQPHGGIKKPTSRQHKVRNGCPHNSCQGPKCVCKGKSTKASGTPFCYRIR